MIHVLKTFVFRGCRMSEYEKLQLQRRERERAAKARVDDALRYQARAAAIAGIAVADR